MSANAGCLHNKLGKINLCNMFLSVLSLAQVGRMLMLTRDHLQRGDLEYQVKATSQQTISIVNGQVDQNRSSEMSSDSSARSPWTGVSQFLPTTQKLLQVSSRFNRYYTNDN